MKDISLIFVCIALMISCRFKNDSNEVDNCVSLSSTANVSYSEILSSLGLKQEHIPSNIAQKFCAKVDGEHLDLPTYIFEPKSEELGTGIERPVPCNCEWIKLNGTKVMLNDHHIQEIDSITLIQGNGNQYCLCIEVRETSEKYGQLLKALNSRYKSSIHSVDDSTTYTVYFIKLEAIQFPVLDEYK